MMENFPTGLPNTSTAAANLLFCRWVLHKDVFWSDFCPVMNWPKYEHIFWRFFEPQIKYVSKHFLNYLSTHSCILIRDTYMNDRESFFFMYESLQFWTILFSYKKCYWEENIRKNYFHRLSSNGFLVITPLKLPTLFNTYCHYYFAVVESDRFGA